MTAYDSYKNRELTITKIERDIDDFGLEDPKVNQIRLVPEHEEIDYIGYKPKKQVEKKKENNGFTDLTTEKERIPISELSEKLIRIAGKLQENDRIDVNISFTRWDQSEDADQDGDETYFFIQGDQFDDLHLVEPEENEENQDEAKDEVF